MNPASLLYPTERIVGLEISNQYIKAILLEKNKKGVFMRAQKYVEMPEGLMKEGSVQDKQKLAELLKKFWADNKKVFRTKKAMVSVSPDFVFTYVLEFPNIDYESLKKAVELSLTSEVVFPVNIADIYHGWERMPEVSPDKSQVFLAFAHKKKIDGYMETARLAGIDAIIFEEPALAVSRALDGFSESPGVVANILSNGVNFGIIYKNRLRFSRFAHLPALSSQEDFNKFIEVELNKIVNFYDNDKKSVGKIKNALVLFPYKEKEALIEYLKTKFTGLSFVNTALKKETPKEIAQSIDDFWLSAYGLALRTLVPRKEDKDVSLTPFSAEESFKKERAMSYFSLWGYIISAMLAFFAVLFLAGMFFMNMLFDDVTVKVMDLKIGVPITKEMTELAKEADKFNALVKRISEIEAKKTNLQASLNGIMEAVPKGSVQPLSALFPDETGQVSLKVTAQNPQAAFALRDALTSSEKFSEVKMPVLGIDQRADITFTITFKILQ